MDYFNILKGELKKGISMVKDNLTKTHLEKKLKEATSNEHCHANISLLNDISNRTQYRADYNTILSHCLKKLSCRPEKWRKILKSLFLIEHILRTGNPRFADDLKDESYKLKNLSNFSYYDDSRSDKGETSKFKIIIINSFNI
jgi:hypothetical protein